MIVTTEILSLGHKGEGVADIDGKRAFVPLALPGEVVTVDVEGDRAALVEVVKASPQRIEPFCRYFGTCGGCQLQHLDAASYRAFKLGLVERPLQQAGLESELGPLVDAAGDGRRRATLHATRTAAGYMRLKSHDLLDIEECPILVPALARRAPQIARAIGALVGACDVSFTASDAGLDVSVRNTLKGMKAEKLAPIASQFGLARIALERELVLQRQTPNVAMGRAQVDIPMSSFLQATAEAENQIAAYVTRAVGKAKKVADLFCGVGPFALRLAETAPVYAADSDKAAIAALDKAARHGKGLRTVTAKYRDLFRDPLTRFELDFDAIVLDPPRAGAEAQVREIAASKARLVVMVACDARSFARDTATLVNSGFVMSDVMAFDQFAWSAHIEMAATFRRK